ncbi:hypothetical protein ACXM1Q_004795 [Streptococcus sp. 10F2]
MAIKKAPIQETTEKRQLGRRQDRKLGNQEYFDLHSSVALLDVKGIIDNRQAYIQLVDYGYLQLMEIPGKDLGSLSYNEIKRTLENFEKWLSDFNTNIQIETTTLPTNTDTQITDLRHHLSRVREEKAKLFPDSDSYAQLDDREEWLRKEIQVEESIQQEIYNTEFILWLFAPTTTDLDELVRKAKSYGNSDFVPQEITKIKKEQILKQFNNMNEKV